MDAMEASLGVTSDFSLHASAIAPAPPKLVGRPVSGQKAELVIDARKTKGKGKGKGKKDQGTAREKLCKLEGKLHSMVKDLRPVFHKLPEVVKQKPWLAELCKLVHASYDYLVKEVARLQEFMKKQSNTEEDEEENQQWLEAMTKMK
eukprot:1325037-Amphidinium_carterae.1